MSDREQLETWLQASAAGDQQAFKRLYEATSPHLYALLLRILRNPDAANDVLQDTYIKVWEKGHLYSPERGAPLTWLLSIARYRALDVVRRRRPEVLLADTSELSEAFDAAAPGPLTQSEVLQMWNSMQDCLMALQSPQRKSVLLAYYEGLTHQELAGRMEAPLGTVKSWVRRGLLSLRECLSRKA